MAHSISSGSSSMTRAASSKPTTTCSSVLTLAWPRLRNPDRKTETLRKVRHNYSVDGAGKRVAASDRWADCDGRTYVCYRPRQDQAVSSIGLELCEKPTG